MVIPSEPAMAPNKGAWLNHTKNDTKKTIQLRCNTFIFPLKDIKLNPELGCMFIFLVNVLLFY